VHTHVCNPADSRRKAVNHEVVVDEIVCDGSVLRGALELAEHFVARVLLRVRVATVGAGVDLDARVTFTSISIMNHDGDTFD
jgi:hypothetical protein